MQRDRTYDRQLVLLGACLASREVLDSVQARDFAELDLGAVLEELQQVAKGKLEPSSAFRVVKYFRETMGVEPNGRKIVEGLHAEVRTDARYRNALSIVHRAHNELPGIGNREAAIEKLKSLVAEL